MINGKPIAVPFGVSLPSRLVDFIPRWLKNSGGEWTAERVKALKVWALHVLAGDRTYTCPWFAKTRYRGYSIPKLAIFQYLVEHLHNLTEVVKVLTVLNSYKLGTWGTPSLSSIMEIKPSAPSGRYIPFLRKYVDLPRVPQYALEVTEAVHTFKSWCDDFGRTHPGPYGLYDDSFPAEIALLYEDMNTDPLCMGRLLAIPDKGKYRTILVGNRSVQLLTKKLADWLRGFLWRQPEVASGDQKKFSRFILDSFGKNRYMMSVDLSNATDRLSVDLQINLLTSMGVPRSFFRFLRLPFFYDPKTFGIGEGELREGRYSNGQPMGLFVSFPMFELAHWVILKFSTAVSKAEFCICGDDVVIACDREDADTIYSRYKNLIERFGGEISSAKTVKSERFAEGVGAIFLKGIQKEIRIPSGKLSYLEACTPGTWLYEEIKKESPVGRAIFNSWLMTKEYKEYSEEHRRALNEFLLLKDLDDWRRDALSYLASHEVYPQRWYSWEDPPEGTGMDNPQNPKDADLPEDIRWFDPGRPSDRFRWITLGRYRDNLVSHKVITLYKEQNSETQKDKD
jgi:hypothetical protein